jgi:hypothetical protein
MKHVYIDESIHPRGGFILAAAVFTEAKVDAAVDGLLVRAGLVPGTDEFKSCARYDQNPGLVPLRSGVIRLIQEQARVGIVVLPVEERARLGAEICKALGRWLAENGSEQPHVIAVDEGIFASPAETRRLALEAGVDTCHVWNPAADSRAVRGLQLADAAAHTCSMLLLAKLGLVTKLVPDPEEPDCAAATLPLEFELWARLRYAFFRKPRVVDGVLLQEDPTYDSSEGLFIAESCSRELRAAAEARFATNYLGCIH